MKVEFEKPYDEDDDDFDYEEFASALRETLLSAAEESLTKRADEKYITYPDIENIQDYEVSYMLFCNAIEDDAKIERSPYDRYMSLSAKSNERCITIKIPRYLYLAMKAATHIDISPYTNGTLKLSLFYSDIYKKELIE